MIIQSKKCIVSVFIFIATGCASTHPGSVAKNSNEDLGLKVSADEVSKYSDDTHHLIDFTLENKGDDWVRIKNVKFACDPECSKNAKVLEGEDLKSWLEALETRLKKEEQNKKALETGAVILGGVGAIVGMGTGNNAIALAGVGVLSAGMIGGMVREINTSVRNAQTSRQVPESHLYHTPMAIPSSNYIRKWMLIHLPKKTEVKTIDLTLESTAGKSAVFHIEM